MFRQMDEAFNNMMKNFGSFNVPDQEQGINQIPIYFRWSNVSID